MPKPEGRETSVQQNAYVLAPGKTDGTLVTPRLDRFIRTHERVAWSFGQIDFGSIQADRLTDIEIDALMGAMLVESHNPVYTARLMDYNRPDHETTGFLAYWVVEEAKHYIALRTYAETLARRGRLDPNKLETVLRQTREGEWGEKESRMTPVQTFLYTMLQEFSTETIYRKFGKATEEPVLKVMLSLLGRDEMRHCMYYLESGKRVMARDRPSLDEIEEVLASFEMPGRGFVPDYERFEAAMIKIAAPGKVETGQAVGKVSEFVGPVNSMKLLARPAIFRRLTGWGSKGN